MVVYNSIMRRPKAQILTLEPLCDGPFKDVIEALNAALMKLSSGAKPIKPAVYTTGSPDLEFLQELFNAVQT